MLPMSDELEELQDLPDPIDPDDPELQEPPDVDEAERFVAQLLETSKKNSPINFVQLGAEMLKELEELGGMAKLVKDRIKYSQNEHVKARMVDKALDILAKAAAEQPASQRVSDLEPEQLKALFRHITKPVYDGAHPLHHPMRVTDEHAAPQPFDEQSPDPQFPEQLTGTDAQSSRTAAVGDSLDTFGQ